ncbi:LAMI_0F00914g1_1 [Lachancea mirantina]|uniref:ER membrane protein complex subunit 1 n=1 Tax=Lachancea mirantina TaxID=1230905 RepID=A0A1G4JVS7_9SACH|nr:LAMI_0F00914g1_1 [Lachancea mirantina]
MWFPDFRTRDFLLYVLMFVTIGLVKVEAVYDDEAFDTDWHLENIGRYECAVKVSNEHIGIISGYQDASMFSVLNSSNGGIVSRQPLTFIVADTMTLEDSKIALKSENGETHILDTKSGLFVGDEITVFSSSCKPDFSVVTIDQGKLQINGLSSPEIEHFHVDLPTDFEQILFLEASNDGFLQALVACKGLKYSYIQYENFVPTAQWSRDESLTDICAYTYMSLEPVSTTRITRELEIDEHMPVFEAYKRRAILSLERVKKAFVARRISPGRLIKEALENDDQETLRQRNIDFGFFKLLIVASNTGQISALSSIDGSKLWTVDTGLEDIIELEIVKTNSELVVFTSSGFSIVFDIKSIEEEPKLVRKQGIVPCSSINRLGSSDTFFAKTKQGFRVVIESGVPLSENVSYIVDHEAGGLSAFVLEHNDLKESWTVDLSPNEKIVGYAGKTHGHTVSVGTILGDRTVLYKYLYPNLAAYAVSDESAGVLRFHIIDTITGELVHSYFHDEKVNVEKPVNMVFGEHWCIYTFFSSEPVPEQKIVVVELYESLTPNERDSVPDSCADPLFYARKPEVITRAYLYPEIIRNLALTATKFDVTTKAVLLELESGQITYLPKSVVSGRRIEESKMTDADKKEFMALPYLCGIPINDQSILTHYRTFFPGSKSSLLSIPTNLESTTLICDIGHDIFCTRLSPSLQFDMLSPSFEKGKLLSTVLGLLLICYFLRPMVNSNRLKTRWLVKS